MRKILAIMGSLSLTTVAAATVISCGVKTNLIEIGFGSQSGSSALITVPDTNGEKEYSLTDVISATTALGSQDYSNYNPGFNSLSQFLNNNLYSGTINSDLFNVLTSVARKIVKPNNDQRQLRDSRNVFAGREDYLFDEKKPENQRYLRPTVDGLILNWEDQEAYYKSFNSTSISSIEGLYKLSKYQGEIGAGLTAAKQLADQAFASGSAGEEFAKIFLGLEPNPYRQAAFTKITYNKDSRIGELVNHYETEAAVFDTQQPITEQSSEITISSGGKYKTVNAFSEKVIEEDEKNVISNRQTDPTGRLILKSELPTAPTKLALLKQKEDKTTPPLVQLTDSNTVYFYNGTKAGDEKPLFGLVPNQVLLQEVTQPINVEYEFETGLSNNHSPIYTLNFNLKNLHAVWIPVIAPSPNVKKANATDADPFFGQVVWYFAGYKFSKGISDLMGYQEDLTSVNTDRLTFERTHRFQDLAIDDLVIEKIVR